jgi:hypothetical protein
MANGDNNGSDWKQQPANDHQQRTSADGKPDDGGEPAQGVGFGAALRVDPGAREAGGAPECSGGGTAADRGVTGPVETVHAGTQVGADGSNEPVRSPVFGEYTGPSPTVHCPNKPPELPDNWWDLEGPTEAERAEWDKLTQADVELDVTTDWASPKPLTDKGRQFTDFPSPVVTLESQAVSLAVCNRALNVEQNDLAYEDADELMRARWHRFRVLHEWQQLISDHREQEARVRRTLNLRRLGQW